MVIFSIHLFNDRISYLINTGRIDMKKILLTLALGITVSFAHSGGTNSAGCHTNSKTGDYHCHKTDVDLLKCDKLSKNVVPDKKDLHKGHSHKLHNHKDHS